MLGKTLQEIAYSISKILNRKTKDKLLQWKDTIERSSTSEIVR